MNTWHQLRLKVTLHLRGPFNSKSSAMGGYGIDAALLRTPARDPLLPGTQVRGRVRDALSELAVADVKIATCVNHHWFGPAADRDAEALDQVHRAGAWCFSDFIADGKALPKEAHQVRITIDSETGSVKTGAMLVAETAASPHGPIAFKGNIGLAAGTSDELAYAVDRLCRALAWIPSMGAFRTVGFGVVEGFEISAVDLRTWGQADPKVRAAIEARLQGLTGAAVRSIEHRCAPASVNPTLAATDTTFELSMEFESPFCIVERRTDRNVSSSVEYVRGAVIKGAVAAQLLFVLGQRPGTDLNGLGANTPWHDLCTHFGKIRFLTALPADMGATPRPFVTPLSLVLGHPNGELRDAALAAAPFGFKGGDEFAAPMFSTDWKKTDRDAADEQLGSGWKHPARELRLHTAINPEHRRAKYQHLFGQDLIRPEGVVWRGMVDFERVPATSRPAVHAHLKAFLEFARLRIGKTKAVANARIGAAVQAQACQAIGGEWVVVLQSPALLVDPRDLHTQWNASETDPLDTLYKAVWQEISNQQLELVRFFADQDLQGGFLGRKRTRDPGVYNPYYVTTAGSVFVLKGVGSQPLDAIKKIANQGLPLPKWVIDRHGDDFRTNPFLPEDGFGEVLVNQKRHEELKPKTGEVTPI